MNENSQPLFDNDHSAIDEMLNGTLQPAMLNSKLEVLKKLADSILVELSSLNRQPDNGHDKVVLSEAVQTLEENLIRTALARTGGIQRKAAAMLGLKPTTLHAKMKRYGLIDPVNCPPEHAAAAACAD